MKKKLIVIIAACLLVVGGCDFYDVVGIGPADWQANTGDDWYGSAGIAYHAQGFSLDSNSYISKAEAYLKGSATVQAEIRSGANPGGTLIATSDIQAVTSGGGWVTFAFSSLPSLTASTQYYLKLTRISGTSYEVYRDTNNGNADGKAWIYWLGVWEDIVNADNYFRIS